MDFGVTVEMVQPIVDGITSNAGTLLPALISIIAVKKVFYWILGAINGA